MDNITKERNSWSRKAQALYVVVEQKNQNLMDEKAISQQYRLDYIAERNAGSQCSEELKLSKREVRVQKTLKWIFICTTAVATAKAVQNNFP